MESLDIARSIAQYEARYGCELRPEAILFDMDGVLYDSMPAHERSWLETAQAYGLEMTTEDVYMFEGQTGAQTIQILMERSYHRAATEREVSDIYALKTKLFNEYNHGKCIPNVKAVVEAVSELRRIIVTGSSQGSLLNKLNEDFSGAFSRDLMVTGLDVSYGKPHPEPYLKGLALLDLQPHQGIVIENAPQGVCSAHSAGCFTIAVNTGPLPDEVLWQEGADLVLPDMLVLHEVLGHFLKR